MTSDCMDDRQGEAMKPSPSPAASDTVKPLTDAALATMREHARIGNRLWSLTDVLELIATIGALKKAIPSQPDVDTVAQEICRALKIDPFQRDGFGDPSVPGGFREFERWEEFRDVAASLLASRGTRWRPLQSELREVIDGARERHNRDGKDAISDQTGYIASALTGFIETNLSRLTGEPSA